MINTALARKRHAALSLYVVYGFLLLCFYSLSVNFLHEIDVIYHQSFYTTCTLLVVVGIIAFIMVLQMPYPLIIFGFNLHRWKSALVESIIYSIVFCSLITLLKWFLINHIDIFKSLYLIDMGGHYFNKGAVEWGMGFIIPLIVYILFCPLQAFIIHGAAQSPTLYFVQAKHTGILSIILATIFFITIHMAFSIVFALAVLIPGLLWSILYYRQRTLLGVSVSHAIIGFWGLFVLGYGELIKILANKLPIFLAYLTQ